MQFGFCMQVCGAEGHFDPSPPVGIGLIEFQKGPKIWILTVWEHRERFIYSPL